MKAKSGKDRLVSSQMSGRCPSSTQWFFPISMQFSIFWSYFSPKWVLFLSTCPSMIFYNIHGVFCKFDVERNEQSFAHHYCALDALAWKKFLSLQCHTDWAQTLLGNFWVCQEKKKALSFSTFQDFHFHRFSYRWRL